MGNRKFAIPEEDFVVSKSAKPEKEEVAMPEVKDEIVESVQQGYSGNGNKKIPYTQGKKGQSLPRLHLALTPKNHEYLLKVARKSGNTMSGFINNLLDLIEDGEIDISSYFDFD